MSYLRRKTEKRPPARIPDRVLDLAKTSTDIGALLEVSGSLTPENFTLDVLKVFLHHLSPELINIPQHVNPNRVEELRTQRVRSAAFCASCGLTTVFKVLQLLQPSVSKEVADEFLPRLEGILEWCEYILRYLNSTKLHLINHLAIRSPTLICSTLRGFETLDPRLERAFMSSHKAASFVIGAFTARDMDGNPHISFEDFFHMHPILDCLQSFASNDSGRQMLFDLIGDNTQESEALRTQVIDCFIFRCEYIKNIDHRAVASQLHKGTVMMGLPDSLQTSPDLAPIVILKQLLDAATNLVKDPTVQRAFLESSFPKTFCEALTAWLVDRPPKRRGPEVVKEGFTLAYKCLWLLRNKGTTEDRLCLRAFESMLDGGMFSLFTYALETIPDKDSELGNTLNAILLAFKPHCLYPRPAATILEQCLIRGGLERVRGPITEKSRRNGVYWTWLNLEVATEIVAYSDEGKIIQLCDNLKCKLHDSGNRQYNPSKRCSGCHAVVYCSDSCQREDWVSLHREECKHAKVDYKVAAQDRKDYSLRLRNFHTLFTYRVVTTAEQLYNDFEAGLQVPLAEEPRIMVLDGWATTTPAVSGEYPNLYRLGAKPALLEKAAAQKGSSGLRRVPTAVSTNGPGPVNKHYFDERAGRIIREFAEGGVDKGFRLVECVFRYGDKEVFVLVKMKASRSSGDLRARSFDLVSSVARIGPQRAAFGGPGP